MVAPDLYVTPIVNLFEGEKNVAHEGENLDTHVALAIYTMMLKSKSERVWKLESETKI